MTGSRFDHRSDELELMDSTSIGGPELHHTLDELERINQLLGGYRPSLDGIAALVPAGVRQLTVLDVGTGGGDLARHLADWADRRGIGVEVLGIDLAQPAVEYAQRRAAGRDGLRFEVRDLFTLDEARPFDIVHAGLVLHHFRGDEAGRALAKMHALARLGVVVNDLHRHPVAYHAIALLTRLLSRSRLIRNDAPLSVLRGFRRGELHAIAAAVGLPPPEIRWRWAFRWQMVWQK